VAVGALGTVYALSGSAEHIDAALRPMLVASWSLPTALSLLAWYVFAPQCLSTLATVRRETNSWRYPLIMAGYLFAMAYAASLPRSTSPPRLPRAEPEAMWQQLIVAVIVIAAAVYAARMLGPRRWRRRTAPGGVVSGCPGSGGQWCGWPMWLRQGRRRLPLGGTRPQCSVRWRLT